MPTKLLTREQLSTLLMTTIALTFFAANSVLCRLALTDSEIDPAGFTIVRLITGALCLWVIVRFRQRSIQGSGASWPAAALLFIYAIFFSYAYTMLDAGVGALILFGSVQLTMIIYAALSGEKLTRKIIIGAFIAFGGLTYLLSPGITAPSIFGSSLMAVAGIAWGGYTLKGRGVKTPTAATAGNFIRSLVFIIPLAVIAFPQIELDSRGMLLATLSGALTSGIGYAIWYGALRGLTATQASILQLLVPVIAAVAGVVLLAEAMTLRLILASIVILGGVAIAVVRSKNKE